MGEMSSYYYQLNPKGMEKYLIFLYKSPLVRFKLHNEDKINLKKVLYFGKII